MIGREERHMNIRSTMRSLGFAFVVITIVALTAPMAFSAPVGIAITIGPPAIPVYEQPVCPGDGYLWTPGYWAYDYDASDYYWVPGTWILAPQPGFLWTPGYWGWGGAAFVFHEGYWGPHVGFYGGINYGFGYFGVGFEGGRWENNHFFYNRAVLNVNVTNIHNVYNTRVVHETTINRVSYNGGNGGITARPTREEENAEHERHIEPVAVQKQHVEAARSDRQLRASVNQGKPEVAATARPGEFKGGGAVPAKEAGAPYRPGNEAPRPENAAPRPGVPNDAKDLQPHERPPAPNTGNAKTDQKYQQQQQKLAAQQEKDHQKLAAQQEKEHQRATKQNADDARKQQMEQRHQQQTQQMEQRHTQQQQHLQQRQQPRTESKPK
jgi:hypothetical protein